VSEIHGGDKVVGSVALGGVFVKHELKLFEKLLIDFSID
jgi:hypothetical protein